MSRSRRKNAIIGVCGRSDKKDKKIANRKHRRYEKKSLQNEDEVFKDIRELSDVWWMEKDGKRRFDPNSDWGKKIIRKK